MAAPAKDYSLYELYDPSGDEGALHDEDAPHGEDLCMMRIAWTDCPFFMCEVFAPEDAHVPPADVIFAANVTDPTAVWDALRDEFSGCMDQVLDRGIPIGVFRLTKCNPRQFGQKIERWFAQSPFTRQIPRRRTW
jgi:hypothetical protein